MIEKADLRGMLKPVASTKGKALCVITLDSPFRGTTTMLTDEVTTGVCDAYAKLGKNMRAIPVVIKAFLQHDDVLLARRIVAAGLRAA